MPHPLLELFPTCTTVDSDGTLVVAGCRVDDLAREMPPPGAPRPDDATYRTTVATLETALDIVAEGSPHPGRVPVHRLNRTEYTNAVRDVLGLEVCVHQ